jgi:hypothetical protein
VKVSFFFFVYEVLETKFGIGVGVGKKISFGGDINYE